MLISFVVTYVVGSIGVVNTLNVMIIVNKIEINYNFLKFGKSFTVNNTGLLVTLFSFASIRVIFSSCVDTLINCVLVVMTTLNLKIFKFI
jgi:hypothetical protein